MRSPTYFLAHGSPMNAIEDNDFTRQLHRLGESIKQPSSILCISAHWMTQGYTSVTAQVKPPTIHDFRGFPEELFNVQYPSPGDPGLAEKIQKLVASTAIKMDDSWGIDHGTWSVLRHLYPKANIPVIQLSLDMAKPASFHFEMGKALQPLRDENILILGSGNIVHNLRQIQWQIDAPAYPWADEYAEWIKQEVEKRNFSEITEKFRESEAAKLSVPTLDHFLPLLYVLGASKNDDQLKVIYDGIQNASISMLTMGFEK